VRTAAAGKTQRTPRRATIARKKRRQGERGRLRDVHGARQLALERARDRLAEVIPVDGLERLAPAAEERDHVCQPRQVAHQVEDAVPLAREHEAGAHDQIAARVAEALEGRTC